MARISRLYIDVCTHLPVQFHTHTCICTHEHACTQHSYIFKKSSSRHCGDQVSRSVDVFGFLTHCSSRHGKGKATPGFILFQVNDIDVSQASNPGDQKLQKDTQTGRNPSTGPLLAPKFCTYSSESQADTAQLYKSRVSAYTKGKNG